jgi:hypothetical protein
MPWVTFHRSESGKRPARLDEDIEASNELVSARPVAKNILVICQATTDDPDQHIHPERLALKPMLLPAHHQGMGEEVEAEGGIAIE